MFRLSRALLAKASVRPVLESAGHGASNAPKPPKGPRITPIGIAFILGGLALGSYVLKPTTRMPTAAMDTFKPQVAIVFIKGDSQGVAREAANRLKFQYLNYLDGMDKMGPLAEKGCTRFIIDGFTDPADIHKVETDIVAPDLVLDFDRDAKPELRIVPMTKSDSIEAVIKQHNLV